MLEIKCINNKCVIKTFACIRREKQNKRIDTGVCVKYVCACVCVCVIPAISHSSASDALAKASSSSGSRVTLSMMGSTIFLGMKALPVK